MRLNEQTITPAGTHGFVHRLGRSICSRCERVEDDPFFLYLPTTHALSIHRSRVSPESTYDCGPKLDDQTRQKTSAFVEHLDTSIVRFLTAIDEIGSAELRSVAFHIGQRLCAIAFRKQRIPGTRQTEHFDGGLRVPCWLHFLGDRTGRFRQ